MKDGKEFTDKQGVKICVSPSRCFLSSQLIFVLSLSIFQKLIPDLVC